MVDIDWVVAGAAHADVHEPRVRDESGSRRVSVASLEDLIRVQLAAGLE